MDAYYDLKDMLCRELEEVVKKGELSAGDLDAVDKLTHSIKSLVTIIAMDEGGYSNGGSYGSYEHYINGGGYSGRRGGRNMNGRYSGRRYSRDEGQQMMVQEFERLMDEAQSEEVRKVIHQAISQLKNIQ